MIKLKPGLRIFCSSLTSVEIGNNVTTIGSYAFYKCSSLTSVHITDLTAWMNIKFKNASSNPLYNGADLYLNGSLVKDKVTSDNVSDTISNLTEGGSYTIIVTGAITNDTISAINTALTTLQTNNTGAKVNLDLSHIENLTELPDKAFQNCGSLTSVTIGNSVTSIGKQAFSGCSSLTSVTFKDTSTWCYTEDENYTGGTVVEVTDMVQNAIYLKDAYCWCNWYKK